MLLTDRRVLLAALSAGLLPPGPSRLPPRPPSPPSGWAPQAFQLPVPGGARQKTPPSPIKRRPSAPPRSSRASILMPPRRSGSAPITRLWRGGPAPDPVSFFHLSRYSADPVVLYALENGRAREILYGPDYFDYSTSGIDLKTLANLGFSGFRLMDGQDKVTDWLAFQGASYFRSSGQDAQYGASARGIAINTALASAEEFPVSRNSGWNRMVRSPPSMRCSTALPSPARTSSTPEKAERQKRGNNAVTMNVALPALLPRQHFAHGRGAADQHVLVWRE